MADVTPHGDILTDDLPAWQSSPVTAVDKVDNPLEVPAPTPADSKGRMTGKLSNTILEAFRRQIEWYQGDAAAGKVSTVLRLLGGLALSDSTQLLTGDGGPELSVIAPKGSLYLDRTGPPDAVLYIKESGAGNTGWVVYAAGGGGGPATDPSWTLSTLQSGGPITYEASHYELVNYDITTGEVTIEAPPTPSDGQQFIIKNANGYPTPSRLIIDGNGKDIQHPVGGKYFAVVTEAAAPEAAVHYVYNGLQARWQIVSSYRYEKQIRSTDLTDAGMTNVVGQYLFDGDLLEEGGSGRDLNYTGTTALYVWKGGKRFVSLPRDESINRGGTHDAIYSIQGDCTIYLTLDMKQMPTLDTVIALFGVPGSNSPGTNYQWAIYFESSSMTIQFIHERGGGIKEIVDAQIPFSGPTRLVCRRDGLDVTMFIGGEPVLTVALGSAPDDGSGTQQLHLGQTYAMSVAEWLISTDPHTDATIRTDAQHVGLA